METESPGMEPEAGSAGVPGRDALEEAALAEQESKGQTARRKPFSEDAEPAEIGRPCFNPGNPVFSCMLAPKDLRTSTSLSKPQMIMYKTTSSDYGGLAPVAECIPRKYFPKDQNFSKVLRAAGMFQDNSLNTKIDQEKVCDASNLQHTL
ncbi:uncharacterized protein C15orf65 homolog [Tachyglossus aculeatus]|uniref:uncharacterized protein C15orf65 homolog n=1 Tax=Tachyglossus aculeatus TaxID=9261 RepID=UPI0018F68285|nr:uncharacterized protein C15orf65 homolog [Tachyglossus aculeatus]